MMFNEIPKGMERRLFPANYLKREIFSPPEEMPVQHEGVWIREVWRSEMADFIIKRNIKALYLQASWSWGITDYSFLGNLKYLKKLIVTSGDKADLSSIENLSELEELSLTCPTPTNINFEKFGNLKYCYVSWWKGAEKIFDCKWLKSLYLDGRKNKDYSSLSGMADLEVLTLANTPIEHLDRIRSLDKLEKVELLNCRKLCDIKALGSLKCLRWLTIDGSKLIDDLSVLAGLKNLEYLNVTGLGEVKSLVPLEALKKLKAVTFCGSTNIVDGDLTPLTVLPNLGMLNFVGKRHYTHRLIKNWSWDNFNLPDILLQKKEKGVRALELR